MTKLLGVAWNIRYARKLFAVSFLSEIFDKFQLAVHMKMKEGYRSRHKPLLKEKQSQYVITYVK